MDLHFSTCNLHTVCSLSRDTREELVSLWTALSKCKRQFRYSLRVENMTWRLWYQQAMMQKQPVPSSATAANLPSTSGLEPPTKALSRSRSTPILALRDGQLKTSEIPPASSRKFYISDSEDDDDEYDGEDAATDDGSLCDSPRTPAATTSSDHFSDDSLFTKQDVPTHRSGTHTSMLSAMLHQQKTTAADGVRKPAVSLRRCQARTDRLDAWFTTTVV